jgi:hypothetical protein
MGQGHVSNFVNGKRGLTLETLDKILAAQRLTVGDLLPARRESSGALLSGQIGQNGKVPLVSHEVAIYEPYIRASSVQTMMPFPAEALAGMVERCTRQRKAWERFVVVRIAAEEARPMDPVLKPQALVLLDRHYNSLQPYRKDGEGDAKGNLYAVRVGARLLVRYAEFTSNRLVLRPLRMGFPVDVIEVAGLETPNDLLVGRVAMVVNES